MLTTLPYRSQPLSFFNELKRRNVFRVGIAYVVAAWLVAQVLQLTFETFGTPDWVMKTVLVLLAAGLPIVLFFSWAFELTAEGLKREREVDRTIELEPLAAVAYLRKGEALSAAGRREEAQAAWLKAGELGEELAYAHLGAVQLIAGNDELAADYFAGVRKLRGEGSDWTNADVLENLGMIFRASGYTNHPAYLEFAEPDGLFDLWDQRGAPDHCQKTTGNWLCN